VPELSSVYGLQILQGWRQVLRLMRMAKLLRLARVQRLLERLEEEYAGLAQASRLLKIIASIIFTAHFVAWWA
jgi:hypothetical protein